MKAFLKLLISVLCLLLLTSGMLILDLFKRRDFVLPRTVIGDMSFAGMTRNEAREALRLRLEDFYKQPWTMAARGDVQAVFLQDLGIMINESSVLPDIPFSGDFSNAEILLWSLAGKRILPDVKVERTEIARVIYEKFPDIPKSKNAYFTLQGKNIKIVEASSGLKPVIDPLVSELEKDLSFFEKKPLVVKFTESSPTVFAADLEGYKDAILKLMPSSLKLTYNKEKWEVNFAKHPDWLVFEKKPYEAASDRPAVFMEWNPTAFSQYLNETMAKKLEQAPDDVRISRGQDGKIIFEGRGNEGKAIEREKLLILANMAIADQTAEVAIPVRQVPPKVEVSDELKSLGINELLGVGYSRFEGSPANRKFNIGVGVAKFNGLLIPQGETFSFGDNLGRVDETTGYRKELVIKPEGTIPEFGGGLCQVSTTMYRAAIYSGLPIKERAPHSYAVTYYSQAGGHGLDATVYPPARDLKFINDTPGDILIQSYVDGYSAYFKFYGTSDGRTVAMEGPFISNRRSPPSEIQYVPDPKLKPGEQKQVEKPHGGFDALWYRYIIRQGNTVKEELVSHYKATPAKFLVGKSITPEGENVGSADGVNPFE